MALFRREQKENSIILALDIGTSALKALVVRTSENGGEVAGAAMALQGVADMEAGTIRDVQAVIDHALQATEAAVGAEGVRPTEVVIGLSGEATHGLVTTTTITREKPENPITEKEIDVALEATRQDALEHIADAWSYATGITNIEPELISSAIVGARLDGKLVTNPVDFSGTTLEISAYHAFAAPTQVRACARVASALGMRVRSMLPTAYTLARALGDAALAGLSAAFVDIGDGATSVALVREGVLTGTATVALGGRTCTQALATALDMTFEKAESTKQAYVAGTLSGELRRAVAPLMQREARVWASGLATLLANFGVQQLPGKLYFAGGAARLPDLLTVLQGEAWRKGLAFAQSPRLLFLEPADVARMHDPKKLLSNEQDVVPLALARTALELTMPGAMQTAVAQVAKAIHH